MNVHLPPAIALAFCLCAGPAAAFTFSDGTTTQCIAGGAVVTEIDAQPADPFKPQNRTALAERTDTGWRITWNLERFRPLPPEVRDFLFFHECAHARVPTDIEAEANCMGLVHMREAGRADPAFEARLRRYFPADSEYWNETFRCANAKRGPARPAPPPAPAAAAPPR
ncbi:MAG: hypothetical protein U1F58_03615 [Burkholderiales bacterium]